MKKNSEFVVPFAGIKLGVHEYDFEFTQTFFENVPHLTIENGRFNVHLELEKKETMMRADFWATGNVVQACSRCNEGVEVELNTDLSVVYKFGTDDEEDEGLIALHPDTYEIDVSHPIYEMIVIALSVDATHQSDQCNQDMLNILKKYTANTPDETAVIKKEDPRWEKLKKLN
jgi:uncharacterized metal-binding protein YceD (DUF177 family)